MSLSRGFRVDGIAGETEGWGGGGYELSTSTVVRGTRWSESSNLGGAS